MARTILLADDSVTAQNMGRRILTDAGYEVITVNNGSAALKRIHESQPDLIVLDVYMPGYGGLEVCQRLKESGETMRIPVLLTVGKMEPFKADEAKRVRADAHIIKPFEASELLAALAKLEDRIVPQADSSRGRRKKPSFWHAEGEAPVATREWTDSVAYLAQVKQRKDEGMASSPEPAQNAEPEPAPVPVKRAFPRVPEATEELPVIADANAAPVADVVQEEVPVAHVPEQPPGAVAAEMSLEPSPAETNASEVKSFAENVAEIGADAQPAAEKSGAAEIPSTIPAEPAEEVSAPGEAEAPVPATVAVARWVAENVALSPEEAALELEQEMHAAEALEKNRAASTTQVSAGVPAQPALDQSNGATFAAAAAASSSGAVSNMPVRSDEQEPVASEAAAAWENWKHIRESVMNLSNAASIAETVAHAANSVAPQDSCVPTPNDSTASDSSPSVSAVSASSPAETSSSSGLEAGALASIVDTVLAELKPKLMEEIAKKLKK